METNWRRVALLTAVAPLAWGSTYIVTAQLLPPDRPLFAAAVRALPAGLVLLALRRPLPTGAVVVAVAGAGRPEHRALLPPDLPRRLSPAGRARRHPAGLLAVRGDGPGLAGDRRARRGRRLVAAAAVGVAGVALLVLRSPGQVDAVGLLAAFGSVAVSALGYVLIKRWPAPVDLDHPDLVAARRRRTTARATRVRRRRRPSRHRPARRCGLPVAGRRRHRSWPTTAGSRAWPGCLPGRSP